jgi:hypothetical protein
MTRRPLEDMTTQRLFSIYLLLKDYPTDDAVLLLVSARMRAELLARGIKPSTIEDVSQ